MVVVDEGGGEFVVDVVDGGCVVEVVEGDVGAGITTTVTGLGEVVGVDRVVTVCDGMGPEFPRLVTIVLAVVVVVVVTCVVDGVLDLVE